MTVVGDGQQSRDFVHVKDVVWANILAMRHTRYPLKGEPLNVGFGKNYKIIDLARRLGDNICYLPARQGEIHDSSADISKIKKILKWSPSIQLYDWIEHNL